MITVFFLLLSICNLEFKRHSMNFDNYKIIPNYNTGKTDLFCADKGEVLACEKTLNIIFDEDYKE